MSSTLIEVSFENADIKSQTNFTTVLSPPLVMDTPSVLQFSEGFIDQRDVGNSGNDSFILDTDTEISAKFAFYENFNNQLSAVRNIDNVRKSAFTNQAISATDENYLGGVYAMYQVIYANPDTFPRPLEPSLNYTRGASPFLPNIQEINLIQEEFKFTIKAGTYTANSIIQLLNDQFQGAFYPDNTFLKAEGTFIGNEDNNFYLPHQHFQDKFTNFFPEGDAGVKGFSSAVIFIRAKTNPINMTFEKEEGASYYYPQENTNKAQIMIGCPIVSLENNDNIISWANLHNPVYKIAERTRGEYIQLRYKDKADNWYWEYARGGVMLTALEPPSFWSDLLGFKTQDFLLNVFNVKNKNILGAVDIFNSTGASSLESSTTRPFIGVGDVDSYVQDGLIDNTILKDTEFTNKDPDYLPAKELQTLEVNDTVAINAVNPIQFAQFNSGGHFRIEVDIGYYINNFNSAKTKKSICCIASREYLTNGFLSVFSGAQPISLPVGSVLSYISVNIIDPITGKTPTDIGNANTFYFSLTS